MNAMDAMDTFEMKYGITKCRSRLTKKKLYNLIKRKFSFKWFRFYFIINKLVKMKKSFPEFYFI